MTTIAYRDGVLAADRRACVGSRIASDSVTKLFPLADGSCLAACGVLEKAMAFIDWLKAKTAGEQVGGMPEIENQADIVHLRADGTLWIMENNHPWRLDTEFCAWGSGAEAALGALHAGLSAGEAVEIAQQVDIYSGGGVSVFTLEKPKTPRKPAPKRKPRSSKARAA